MGEQMLKLTVNEVNNVLNSDYNMISFDSLPRDALLQIVVDCLHKMDTFPKVDLQHNMEEALTKLIKFLSDIKTPEAIGVDMNNFADGIISGKRTLLLPTLFWILSNQEEVKKRSYLSKYLIKVELNAAITNEPDIQPILQQYDDLLQQFKRIYTQTTKYNKFAKATVQLRNEIEKQTKNTTNIVELLTKQKAKMENIPNKETLLVSVKGLRSEMATEKQLLEQIAAQVEVVSTLRRSLREAQDRTQTRRLGELATSGDLGSRLQHEVQTTRTAVAERASGELEELRERMRLAEVAAYLEEPDADAQPAALRDRVDRAQLDLNELVERSAAATAATAAGGDDKLAQFRQHAALIANGKRLAAQRLVELREECGAARRQVAEREHQLRDAVGGGGAALPHGSDLRQFVGGLRDQSLVYKEARGRLLELQSEAGVLARTRDLLAQLDPQLENSAVLASERQRGDGSVMGSGDELRRACADVMAAVARLRTSVAQSASGLRDSVAVVDRLHEKHQQQKQIFDFALESHNKTVNTLRYQVKQLEENIAIEEGKWKEIRTLIDEKDILLESLYKESTDRTDLKKSNVEILKDKIKDEDRKKVEFQEEMRKSERDKEEREQQTTLWHSTLALLQCKRETCPSQ